MPGHNHVWSQMCLGTNVSGHKRVWAQTCLGTNVVEPSGRLTQSTDFGVNIICIFFVQVRRFLLSVPKILRPLLT